MNILFDMGGVLISPGSFGSLGRVLGPKVELGSEKAYDILDQEWVLARIGKLTLDQFYTNLGYEFGMKPEEIKEFILNYYRFNAGAVNLMAEVRKKCKVYIFTNMVSDVFEKFKLDVDGSFTSFEYGLAKPEMEFYKKVQEKLGTNDILFIDDKLYNLRPAGELGWDCIPFKNVKQLKEELGKRNLLS